VPEVDPEASTRESFAQHTADEFSASGFNLVEMMVAADTTDDFLMRR